MNRGLLYSIFGIALFLLFGTFITAATAQECANNKQIRLGPVPLDESTAGVRFNYFNTSKKIANVTANFYLDENVLLDTQTATVEPGKGLTLVGTGEWPGASAVLVLANIGFEDPLIAFEDPLIAFEVPLFMTSLETFDEGGRTGIWGTNGTSIVKSVYPGKNSIVGSSIAGVAFPPVTVAPGEVVQLAVTNAGEGIEGNVYLELVDTDSGNTIGDGDNIFCQPVFCGKTVCDWVCGPKAVPAGGKLEIEFEADSYSGPKTVIPIVKVFEVPLFMEKIGPVEPNTSPKGFEVPLFMPTVTVRSDSGAVKIFSEGAGQLTPPSCQR